MEKKIPYCRNRSKIKYQNHRKMPKKNSICRKSSKIKYMYQNRRKRQNRTYKIHDRSLFWQGTGPSIKSGGVKLVLRAPNLPS